MVASEIKKLAEQPASSTKAIDEIVQTLLLDSRKTVDIMTNVSSSMEDKLLPLKKSQMPPWDYLTYSKD